jgi:hypothetical protein
VVAGACKEVVIGKWFPSAQGKNGKWLIENSHLKIPNIK